MYKKIKKQNGEKFAQTLRNFHSGILEIPDIDRILRHAGRDAKDAEAFLPYLMSLMSANDDNLPEPQQTNPFTLLEQAGYNAFYADTLEKQNSIIPYFAEGELLCTFNDHARYQNYHIVHAVRKDVDAIKRDDFRGREQREDDYGTSVISIQMLKRGGFISIKNRYNHSVPNCDNTFNSDPDSIIEGLSTSLKEHFNVDFSTSKSPLPEGFVIIDGQAFKYREERNNIYYGDQAWVNNGTIHTVNRGAGDALFDKFLFDNKTKRLIKINPQLPDGFADDFNKYYGGNKGLHVKNGNLVLEGDILIGAENSAIKTLYLPKIIEIDQGFCMTVNSVTHIDLPSLISMKRKCFYDIPNLTNITLPSLQSMGNSCFYSVINLMNITLPSLQSMGEHCFTGGHKLTNTSLPSLLSMGNSCFYYVPNLTNITLPSLQSMGENCFTFTRDITHVNFGSLEGIPKHLLPLCTNTKANTKTAPKPK